MNWLLYSITLYKLNHRRGKKIKDYRKELDTVGRNGTPDEIEKVKYGGYINNKIIDEEIATLMTERLISKANKLVVYVPDKPSYDPEDMLPENEYWKRSELGIWYLKPKGIVEVRNQISQEEKKWREKIAVWIGLIGALTGLMSVIKLFL